MSTLTETKLSPENQAKVNKLLISAGLNNELVQLLDEKLATKMIDFIIRKKNKLSLFSNKVLSKFTLQKTVTFIVPHEWKPETALADFRKSNVEISNMNLKLTDINFVISANCFISGHLYEANFYKANEYTFINSIDIVSLSKVNREFLGNAQGLGLLYSLKKEALDNGYWNVSLDKKNNLYKEKGRSRRVSFLKINSDSSVDFDLGYYTGPWERDNLFILFRDLGPVTPETKK